MKAVIFDMDGVIIDSEPLWRRAEREIFASVGLELTDADCERTMGMRTDEVVAQWYAEAPWQAPAPQVVEASLRSRMIELITTQGQPMPGLAHALDTVRSHGLTIALASSSAPVLIDTVLRTLDLGSIFAVVCSAIDEPLGKPHPGIFLTAARRLGVLPSECVVLEDSPAGITAALAAGMRVVAIPSAHLETHPIMVRADVVLSSLEELEVEHLAC